MTDKQKKDFEKRIKALEDDRKKINYNGLKPIINKNKYITIQGKIDAGQDWRTQPNENGKVVLELDYSYEITEEELWAMISAIKHHESIIKEEKEK